MSRPGCRRTKSPRGSPDELGRELTRGLEGLSTQYFQEPYSEWYLGPEPLNVVGPSGSHGDRSGLPEMISPVGPGAPNNPKQISFISVSVYLSIYPSSNLSTYVYIYIHVHRL